MYNLTQGKLPPLLSIYSSPQILLSTNQRCKFFSTVQELISYKLHTGSYYREGDRNVCSTVKQKHTLNFQSPAQEITCINHFIVITEVSALAHDYIFVCLLSLKLLTGCTKNFLPHSYNYTPMFFKMPEKTLFFPKTDFFPRGSGFTIFFFLRQSFAVVTQTGVQWPISAHRNLRLLGSSNSPA